MYKYYLSVRIELLKFVRLPGETGLVDREQPIVLHQVDIGGCGVEGTEDQSVWLVGVGHQSIHTMT